MQCAVCACYMQQIDSDQYWATLIGAAIGEQWVQMHPQGEKNGGWIDGLKL